MTETMLVSDPVDAAVAIALMVVLARREVLRAATGPGYSTGWRGIDWAIAPLIVVFTATVAVRVGALL